MNACLAKKISGGLLLASILTGLGGCATAFDPQTDEASPVAPRVQALVDANRTYPRWEDFPRSTDPAGEEVGTGPVGAIPLRRAGEGETVLLVEDDEQVLGMAVESLEELRYRVVVARNAAEALGHLTGVERIDILFSDVVMPGGMNGSQLAVEAQRLRPGIKVLLTSGYVANLDEGQVIGRGELPVLNKPYRRDELARSLRLVLGGGER